MENVRRVAGSALPAGDHGVADLGSNDLQSRTNPPILALWAFTINDMGLGPSLIANVSITATSPTDHINLSTFQLIFTDLGDANRNLAINLGPPTISGNTETLSLSDIALDNSNVGVGGPFERAREFVIQVVTPTSAPITLTGTVEISAVPLTRALPRFASGVIGLWRWSKRLRSNGLLPSPAQ